MTILAVVAIAMVVLGWMIEKQKKYYLISGYNTMPAARKKQVDIEGLAKELARFLYILAAFFLLLLLSQQTNQPWLGMISLFGTLFLIPVGLFRFQKYDASTRTVEGKYKKTVIGLVLIGLLPALGVMFMMGSGMKEPAVDVQNGVLTIGGMYGETVPLANIDRAELIQKMPELKARLNGFDMNGIRKGWFQTTSGKVIVFITGPDGPFLKIHLKDGSTIYYNAHKAGQVEQIQKKIGKTPF